MRRKYGAVNSCICLYWDKIYSLGCLWVLRLKVGATTLLETFLDYFASNVLGVELQPLFKLPNERHLALSPFQIDLITNYSFSYVFLFSVVNAQTDFYIFLLFNSVRNFSLQALSMQRYCGFLEWCPTRVSVTSIGFGIEVLVQWLLQTLYLMLAVQVWVAGMVFLRR